MRDEGWAKSDQRKIKIHQRCEITDAKSYNILLSLSRKILFQMKDGRFQNTYTQHNFRNYIFFDDNRKRKDIRQICKSE